MIDRNSSIPGRSVPVQVHWLRPGAAVATGQDYIVEAFIPNPLPPPLSRGELLDRVYESLEDAVATLKELEGRCAELPDPRLLWFPLLLREARLSSKIENTIATTDELALFAAGVGQDRPRVREVYNYVEAMEYGLASQRPLTLGLIKDLHRILLAGTESDDKRPGEFRGGQVFLGKPGTEPTTARFVPPPGERVEACMRDLEMFINAPQRWAREASPRWPVPVALAMAHYQFEAIHPFRDGNGRIGRLLVSLGLVSSGLISRPLVHISGFFARDPQQQMYYDALRDVSLKGDWFGWIDLFCRALAAQSRDALQRADQLLALRRRYRDAVSRSKSPLVLALVDLIFESPTLSAPLVVERFRNSALKPGPQTALRALRDLERFGLITYLEGQKPEWYRAGEVLAIADRPSTEETAQATGGQPLPILPPPHPPT